GLVAYGEHQGWQARRILCIRIGVAQQHGLYGAGIVPGQRVPPAFGDGRAGGHRQRYHQGDAQAGHEPQAACEGNGVPHCVSPIFLNSLKKLSWVACSIVLSGTPRSSAIFSATCTTLEGSLVLPRYGTGARYGESVSISIRSSGVFCATSCTMVAFLNVTIPENEM